MKEVELRNNLGWHSILLIGLVLLLASSVVNRAPTDAIATGGNGQPIELKNNPDAVNPTYAELVAFIEADRTDTKSYINKSWKGLSWIKGYVSADFAADVHNNAEAAGIRAGWVIADFEGTGKSHGLNAFETTDRGLVYIDSTGEHFLKRAFRSKKHDPPSWDKVAYVEIGKEHGLISIAKAKSLSYNFYEQYKQKGQLYEKLLSDYNSEVIQEHQEIKGKVYDEGSPEEARIIAWETRLKKEIQMIEELSEELGDLRFEPLGVVSDIRIFW